MAVSVAHRRRGLFFVGLAVGGVGFALSLQMGLDANFTADVMGLEPLQRGLVEAFRETGGLTALLILVLLAGLAEPMVGAALLSVFAVGLGAYYIVPDFAWLIIASMVWSQGFHVWVPLPDSMTLALAEPGRAGHRIGQVRAAGAVGAGLGLLAGFLLHWKLDVTIRQLYLVAGAAGLVAAAACLAVPRNIKTPGPRLVLRRKYSLFYLLNFLDGWRRQIFVAFATFLLVKTYGAPLLHILLLRVAVQILMWLAAPWVGCLVDRVGERKVLVVYFGALVVFFLGYALIRRREILYALFVIDSAFFALQIAITTYVNRIAPPEEHTATLSMGVAFNHVAAVTMPLAGGLIWEWVGSQWVFVMGAAVALLSVIPALRVPPREKSGA
jgi:predicted MFS family arabinose efflux permease